MQILGPGRVKKLGIAVLAAAFASLAHAADLPTLPTTKPADAKPAEPPCFSSLWNYLKSSIRDCPLSLGPLTLYGTLDGGFGYEQWGAHVGRYADKPNYAIQRNSGDTHWLWSPNGLSTSTIGVRLSQKIGDNWKISAPSKEDCRRRRSGVQSVFAPLGQRTALASRQQSLDHGFPEDSL